MVFKETQSFAPWALWLMRVMLLIYILGFFAFIHAIGFHPASLLWFVVTPAFLLLEFAKLRTEVDAEGVRINFFPLSKKAFAGSNIETAKVLDYGFIGGWGIRLGTRYGTAYNTQGCEGLALTLKNGKKVLIGTLRKQAMERAIDQYFKT